MTLLAQRKWSVHPSRQTTFNLLNLLSEYNIAAIRETCRGSTECQRAYRIGTGVIVDVIAGGLDILGKGAEYDSIKELPSLGEDIRIG
jgi:hypothetical protein